MTRTTTPLIFIGLSLLPLGAGALGLGQIQVHSALNQPLDAEIELVASQPAELDNLFVDLAPARTFNQAGVERTPLLSELAFEVVSEGGRDLVRITTQRPVREPFLNFLIEVTNNQGRVVREFTVLLDPPDYRNPPPRRVVRAPSPPVASASPSPSPSRPTSAAGPAPVQEPLVTGDQVYGPVTRGETLWQIADRLRPPSVSVQQMIQALYRANPQAFAGSPDSLRAGARLQVPVLPGSPAPVPPAPQVAATPPPAPPVVREPPPQAPTPAEAEVQAETEEPVIGDPATRPRVRLVPPPNQETAQEGTTPFGEAALEGQAGGVAGGVAGGQGEEAVPGGVAATGAPALAINLRIPTDQDRLTGLRLSSLEDLRTQLDALGQEATRLPAGPRPQGAGSTTTLAPSPLPEQTPVAAPSPRPAPTQPGLVEGLLRSLEGLLLPLGGLILVLVLLLGLLLVRRRRARGGVPQAEEEDQGFTVLESTAPPPAPGKVSEPGVPLAPIAAGRPRPVPVPDPVSTETPLERADLLIAVGNYEEAENLVRSALDRQPDNAALGAKLLDIHYATGNLEAFRDEAERLRRQLDDDNDPLWLHVETMGQDLLPDDPLFGAPTAAGQPVPPLAAPAPVQADRWILNWEPGKPAADKAESSAPEPPPFQKSPLTSPASSFSADETFTRLDPEEDQPLPAPPEVADDEDFFKEVFEDLEWQEDTRAQPSVPPPGELPDLEFDLDSLPDLNRSNDAAGSFEPVEQPQEVQPVPPAQGDNPFAADDYVETKLDLAVAYLDMEDPVGARSLLEEVVQEGNDGQRSRARELMGRLSG